MGLFFPELTYIKNAFKIYKNKCNKQSLELTNFFLILKGEINMNIRFSEMQHTKKISESYLALKIMHF